MGSSALQDSILTRPWFNERKSKKKEHWRYRQVRQKNPKVGVKLQFRWENQFDPLLFHVYYYCDADLWFCLILGKTGLQYFKIGLFYSYLSIHIYVCVCVCVCVLYTYSQKNVPLWNDPFERSANHFRSFISNLSVFFPLFNRVIHKVTLSFTPYPLFQLVSAK
jgi:hypothetical protein